MAMRWFSPHRSSTHLRQPSCSAKKPNSSGVGAVPAMTAMVARKDRVASTSKRLGKPSISASMFDEAMCDLHHRLGRRFGQPAIYEERKAIRRAKVKVELRTISSFIRMGTHLAGRAVQKFPCPRVAVVPQFHRCDDAARICFWVNLLSAHVWAYQFARMMRMSPSRQRGISE